MKKIYFGFVLLFMADSSFAQEVLHVANGAVISVQNNALLSVHGGVVLENGSMLINDGIINLDAPTAGVAILLDGTSTAYTYGPGTFSFTGTGSQFIGSNNLIGRLLIENSVTFTSDIRCSKWVLKSGKIKTGPFIAIVPTGDPTFVEADAANPGFSASWFIGNLRRRILPSSYNNYVFPVGDDSQVHVAEIDNLSANPLTGIFVITVSFTPKPGTDAGLNVNELGTSYTSVNTGGAWHLVPNPTPTGGSYDLKLYFNGFTGLTDNSFGLLMRPDVSSDAHDWQAPAASFLPPSNSPGRTVAGGFARRNNLTVFGQAGIGLTARALPLTLLSFTATKAGSNVLLKWVTSNESNTSHFELLKGQQSGILNYLGRVTASGNTNGEHPYNYTDQHPYAGINFYQLKMIDRDNRFQLSPVIRINFDEPASFKVYPNPVLNNEIFIDASGTTVNDVKMFTTDGTQVRCSFTVTSNNIIKLNIPYTLAKGMYTIQVISEKGKSNTMIIVQ